MFVRKRTACSVAMIAGTALAAAMVTPAAASPSAPPQLKVIKTLSSDFVGPLQFAVNGKHVYVADDFLATLNEVGVQTPIATNPGDGHEIAGVGVDPATGAIAYTTATSVGEEGVHTASSVVIKQAGKPDVVADTFNFEQTHNPDRILQYGVPHPSACVRKALTAGHVPVNYKGQLDTHPYAITPLGGGAWAVADAGSNDILRVGPTGVVTTLAVLPRQPWVVSADFAKANHLPKCVVGVTYYFEAVPTDVEVAPNGTLYATTLPGGDGAVGKVYELPSTTSYGVAKAVATGFAGATNLAFNSAGHMFVAELGSGQLAQVVNGKPVPVFTMPGLVGVEFAKGHLYVSTAPAALQEGSTSDGPPPAGQILELGKA
jgi:hypothetical protein